MAIGSTGTTIVAKGTSIVGSIESVCKMHIDGTVDGAIQSSNVVTVGEAGIIKGEIVAQKLVVTGRIDGNVECDHVEILEGGKISGDVLSQVLVIEPRGQFEGRNRIKPIPGAVLEKKGSPELVVLHDASQNK